MKKIVFQLTWGFILLATSITAGSTMYSSRDAYSGLRGISAFAVNVDPPHGIIYGNLKIYGISRENLQKRITEKLENAGIDVISYADSIDTPGAGVLDLRLRVVIPEYYYYSYNLYLSVRQKVKTQQGQQLFLINTWSDTTIGALEESRLTVLNDYADKMIDEFIEEYKAQN